MYNFIHSEYQNHRFVNLHKFQAQLVRDLKSKKDKSIWQPQVQILLEMKKKLADAQRRSKQSTLCTSNHKETQVGDLPHPNSDVTDEIAHLEAAVLKQVYLSGHGCSGKYFDSLSLFIPSFREAS